LNQTVRRAEVLLAFSALALASAPLLMPASYSVLTHSVSESAAQGVEGAWLARTGLALLGASVLMLGLRPPRHWTRWARAAHISFGVSMVATAVFSHAPWDGSPHDRFEDFLHSAASFGVGMSFTIGVVLVALTGRSARRRALDLVAIVAAIAIPLIMPRIDAGGLAQRTMFLIAILWYGMETVTERGAMKRELSPPA
jgi:hypothetical protein